MTIRPHSAFRYLSCITVLESWWTLYICLCLKKGTLADAIVQTLKSGFFFFLKISFSFLKEPIVSMTWIIQLPLTPLHSSFYLYMHNVVVFGFLFLDRIFLEEETGPI